MKVYKFLERFFLNLINQIWVLFILIHEYKNIIKKRELYKFQ